MVPSSHSWKRAKGAAAHFGIGVSTLWLWAKERPGFPPPLKAGPGVTLFDIHAIESFLCAQSPKCTPASRKTVAE